MSVNVKLKFYGGVGLYTGIREINPSEEELAEFYEGKVNYEVLPNQYLAIKQGEKYVDKYKKDKDGKLKQLNKFKAMESSLMGKIKPKNFKQELFFDLLETDIPLVTVGGQSGSGKTFLTTCYALQELEKRKYDKIVFIRNNVSIANVPELGILPGDEIQKLRGYFAYVADILNPFMFDNYLQQQKVEVAWLGSMRGRSISNSFCICSESQNLTTELVKMTISRMGEGSRLVFDYDLDQIDRKVFEKDSGIMTMINSLQGNPSFGMVTLDLVERSELAKLASLIK